LWLFDANCRRPWMAPPLGRGICLGHGCPFRPTVGRL
jgi:hypothetical protein